MDPVKLRYGLEETPPPLELIFLGLQWFAIAVPVVLIAGKVIAGLHFSEPGEQIVYLQKIFFISGIALLAQLLWGHRLPLLTGPATILLVGIIAGRSAALSDIYTAIALGGLLLFLLSAGGLFKHLGKLFTPPVVAVILVLIAFTLAPTILKLILSPAAPRSALPNLVFSLVLVLALFGASRLARGLWNSTLLLWALIAGSAAYALLFPGSVALSRPAGAAVFAGFFHHLNLRPSLDPGVILAFLICFLALSINDLGSIYSVGSLLKPDRMPGRVSRGLSLTGLLNLLAGMLGVIGPVNFSLSPGVIASTGCGSRYPLIPAGAILAGIAFVPPAIAFIGSVPDAVVGSVLLYILCAQIAAGLTAALEGGARFSFERGLVMGLPLMLGIIISFLPESAVDTFPVIIRPVLGNGFVAGVLAALIMEHLIFRRRTAAG